MSSESTVIQLPQKSPQSASYLPQGRPDSSPLAQPGSGVESLEVLVEKLYGALRAISYGSVSAAQVAVQVERTLSQLVCIESGKPALDRRSRAVFASLLADQQILALFDSLVARSACLQDLVVQDVCGARELLSDFKEFTHWYLRRKSTLLAYDREFSDGESEKCKIFDVEVFQTVQHKMRGSEICSSLKLSGSPGEIFWLALSVTVDGELVRCAEGWESWSEQDTLRVASLDGDRAPFTLLYPIKLSSTNVIVDVVSLFVPDMALEIVEHAHDLTYMLKICDRRFHVVTRYEQSAPIPARDLDHDRRGWPAPHSLGIWPSNLLTGESLGHVQLEQIERVREGGVSPALRVVYDLVLVGRDAFSEPVIVEHLLRDEDLRLVTLRSPSESGVVSRPFRYIEQIHPTRPISRSSDRDFIILLDQLCLSAGGQRVFLESVAYSSKGEILCGQLTPVDLYLTKMESIPELAIESDLERVSAVRVESARYADSGLAFLGCDYRIRTAPTQVLEVSARFRAGDGSDQAYQCTVGLEPERWREHAGDRSLVLEETILHCPDMENVEGLVVTAFCGAEVAQLVANTKGPLSCAVTVRDRDGRTILSSIEQLFCSGLVEGRLPIESSKNSFSGITLVNGGVAQLWGQKLWTGFLTLNLSPHEALTDQIRLSILVRDKRGRLVASKVKFSMRQGAVPAEQPSQSGELLLLKGLVTESESRRLQVPYQQSIEFEIRPEIEERLAGQLAFEARFVSHNGALLGACLLPCERSESSSGFAAYAEDSQIDKGPFFLRWLRSA